MHSSTTPRASLTDGIRHQIITGSDTQQGDWFSYCSINGSTLLIGAPKADHASGTLDSGAAYFFRFRHYTNSWDEMQKFTVPGTSVGADQFGAPTAIGASFGAIGSSRADDPTAIDSGAAYVFRHETCSILR